MALNSKDGVIEQVESLIGSVCADFDSTQQEAIVQQALNELMMTLPEAHAKRCFWILERTKRHGLYQVVVTQAERFRYKQIHLQQKFDNYFRLISHADDVFAEAMKNDIAGIFPIELVDAEAFAANGFWVNPAGFVYDELGRDLTYAY